MFGLSIDSTGTIVLTDSSAPTGGHDIFYDFELLFGYKATGARAFDNSNNNICI